MQHGQSGSDMTVGPFTEMVQTKYWWHHIISQLKAAVCCHNKAPESDPPPQKKPHVVSWMGEKMMLKELKRPNVIRLLSDVRQTTLSLT